MSWTSPIQLTVVGGTAVCDRSIEVGVDAAIKCRVYGVVSLGRGTEHESDMATERQTSVRRRRGGTVGGRVTHALSYPATYQRGAQF